MALQAYAAQLARIARRAYGEHRTSAVVYILDLDILQQDTSLDRVHLVNPARCRKAQPLSVQQGDHVSAIYAFSCLPADM